MTHRTRETQESIGSEVVSREIDPVLLFICSQRIISFHARAATEHWEIVTYLTQLITSRSN